MSRMDILLKIASRSRNLKDWVFEPLNNPIFLKINYFFSSKLKIYILNPLINFRNEFRF